MSKKILIIDDEVDVGEFVKDFLQDQGYETFLTQSASEGIRLVSQENPKVVLLDVLMPEMSGLECLKGIMQAAPETIVVMVSGVQDEQIAKEAIQQGAYDYVSKPFDFNYLENTILARIFS